MWEIVALDANRIRVTSDGAGSGNQWNYVISGNVGTIEAGSFSGGADVDAPGSVIRTIQETLTLRADGSLFNEVFYEYTSAAGEMCTEEQEIVLTREEGSGPGPDPGGECEFDGSCGASCGTEDPDCCQFDGECDSDCGLADPDCG